MKKFMKWLRDERHIVWGEYGILALLIMAPLLLSGYILTLDLVFTPRLSWPTELTNSSPFEAVLWSLNFILPSDVIEKIILFLILVLSGAGMHRLILQFRSADVSIWRWAAYFAGVFYMINPFTYSRFMAGQWMVLAGYALLPFFVASLLKLLAKPSMKRAIKTALWIMGITVVSLHHVGMLVLLAVLIIGMGAWQYRGAKRRQLIKYAGLSIGVSIVVSSFWWLPMLLGLSGAGRAIADFNQTDAMAFATSGGALGSIGDVIRLQGFWAEAQKLFVLPQAVVPVWGLVVLPLWILVIIGAIKSWRRHRLVIVIAGGSMVLGIILAATPIITWVAQAMPLFSAYREPHKFVNLVAFGYAILGAFGLAYIVTWVEKKKGGPISQGVIFAGLLLPIIITPTMLWGFAGQLAPRHYPSEWYALNKELNDKTLFLPWHQYMKYEFSGRIIASPVEKFFSAPVVASDDPEFQGVSPTVPNAEKKEINEALKRPEVLSDVLRKYNFKRVVLLKEDDYKKYDYLNQLKGVHLLNENARLKLYEVKGVR